MATWNEGKSKSPELPTEQDLVAYNHVAAGHEGISSTDDGSVIIKPCTEAEINFYEAAQTHEALKSHIPIFMGVLALNPAPADSPKDVGPAGSIPQAVLDHVKSLIPGNNTKSLDAAVGPASKRVSWKPSGGKKINTSRAIVLENVASDFRHPNILDIKLGARLWADDAPQAKRVKLDDVASKTTSSKLGYRIAGMKRFVGPEKDTSIYDLQSKGKGVTVKDDYLCYDKEYGRVFDTGNVKNAFLEFFGGTPQEKGGKASFTRSQMGDIFRRILGRLTELKDCIACEETRMYSASILLVLEGDLSEEATLAAFQGDEKRQQMAAREQVADHSTNQRENEGYPSFQGSSATEDTDLGDGYDSEDSETLDGVPKLFDLRLIDFAHAEFVPGQGADQNMLHGIMNLLDMFSDLVNMT